jgi:hypothetical protein
MSTLHLHLDESGDLNFSPRGSRYYLFAAVWTYNPLPLAIQLQLLRFRLLKQGSNIEKFHASSDHGRIRQLVISKILSYPDWKFAAVVVQKNKVPPKDREHLGSFYSRFATMPLSLVLRGPIREHAHNLLVYTDRFPGQCNRELTEKAIKIACRAELPDGFPFHVYHHASASNLWLQVADYCAYAIARKWEQGDSSLYTSLQHHLAKEEADVLCAESNEYY